MPYAEIWSYAAFAFRNIKFSISSIIVDGFIFILIYPHKEEFERGKRLHL